MSLFTKITRKDYLLHFIAGTLIFCFCVLFLNPIVSLAVVLSVAFTKEIIWDGWLMRGTVELKDTLATLLGGFIPFFALILH